MMGPLAESGTFSRENFTFDKEGNVYTCPAGKTLMTTGKLINDGETLLYLASTHDCRSCQFKAQCCPKAPFRRIQRSIYEEARDVARALAKTEAFEQSRCDRKRIEILFAILKRILRLGRLRLRGCGVLSSSLPSRHCPEPTSTCKAKLSTASGSRCVSVVTNA